jgi:hypothetical protein
VYILANPPLGLSTFKVCGDCGEDDENSDCYKLGWSSLNLELLGETFHGANVIVLVVT